MKRNLLFKLLVISLLLTSCGNTSNNSGQSGDILKEEVRTITFDAYHNVLKYDYNDNGIHTGVDNKGDEFTYTISCFKDVRIMPMYVGPYIAVVNNCLYAPQKFSITINLKTIKSYRVSYEDVYFTYFNFIFFEHGERMTTGHGEGYTSKDASIEDLEMMVQVPEHGETIFYNYQIEYVYRYSV